MFLMIHTYPIQFSIKYLPFKKLYYKQPAMYAHDCGIHTHRTIHRDKGLALLHN